MSYGLMNWWWGEEVKDSDDYLAKWWKHQRDNYLTDFHINPEYETKYTDSDYKKLHITNNTPYNPKDGRYLFWENDGSYCLILDRRYRFSDPKRPSQPHPDFMIPRGSDLERRHTNLTQLGWGDGESFSRLLAQKQLLEKDGAATTDLMMFCEDDEEWFQQLLDPNSELNTSFFPNKQAYQQFMRDNFILVSPYSGMGKTSFWETFPELEQQQENYEDLYDEIYGVDWEDRFDPDDLKTLLFFRPKLRNYIVEQLMIEYPHAMEWLLDGIIHSIFTTPKDPEKLEEMSLIRTEFMTFLEKTYRKHLYRYGKAP